jgi:hypothetical protein
MADPTSFQFPDGVTYICHPDHRNTTPNKSQWRIVVEDERQCFATSRDRDWLDPAVGWGLHLIDEVPNYLGVAQDHRAATPTGPAIESWGCGS